MTHNQIGITIIVWEISKYVIKNVWYKLHNKF
jgi:hypothetical protein